jgi:dihydroorotase
MSKTIIKNGTIVQEEHIFNTDILILDGKIAKIGDVSHDDYHEAKVVDASGLHVFAGFIDTHVHLRDPGQEYKEDILSGSRAAIAGGVTSMICMPNTAPSLDNPAMITYIKAKTAEVNLCKIFPAGTVTKNREGKELAEIGLMKRAGAVAFTDDGSHINDSGMMRTALEYAASQDAIVITHAEDKSLVNGGEVNEGYASMTTGLKPNPRVAEDIAVMRDVALLRNFGKKLHIAHVSTKGAIEFIRQAKNEGLAITAEVAPHHFTLTEDAVTSFDTNTKVAPPLRTQTDVDAIIEALRDGTIDTIATDHAPHHIDEKQTEYSKAAFGITGLETLFALSYTKLVRECGFSLNQLTKLLTSGAKRIFNLPSGTLQVGEPADIAIVDLNAKYKIDKTKFKSKGKNTPFHGTEVFGAVKYTLVNGEIKN